MEEFLAYQSIFVLPEFSKHSFEEIRLADYEKGAGPILDNNGRGLFAGRGFGGSVFEQKSSAGSGDAGSRNTFGGITSGITGAMSTPACGSLPKPPASSTFDERSPPSAKRLKCVSKSILSLGLITFPQIWRQ